MTDNSALRVMAEYYRLTGQTEKFETLAAHAREELAEKPGPMAKPAEISGYNNRYYQFLRLAKNAGLSTEGLSPAPPVEAAERAAVADFEAEDLDGKRWRPADWRGKVVLVHVWAGWSSLSKEEHPDLQKLYEQLSDDPDRMLVSIAADGETGEIRDYMKANGYTFPVLLGRAAAESVFPPVSFPRNWLLDAKGRRLTHNVSFAGEGGRAWLLLLMDQVQARDTLASLAPGREKAPAP
jgi:thiol-disulfide isomerase/thioredoxin